mmetsp:Transcript_9935/g.32867  ORF Transcript_9935/g.32867 Transcript_9935/m.32867 type:complete len:223 (-) Transcript_9935:338-1006(-)
MRCCRAAPWGPLRRMTYDAATLKYAPKPQPPQPHPTTPWDHFSLTPTLVTLSHFHPLSHAAALRSRGPTTCALQSPGSNFLRLWSATVTALPSPQLQSLPEKLQLPASVPWREPRRRPRHLHMLSAFGCQSGRRRPVPEFAAHPPWAPSSEARAGRRSSALWRCPSQPQRRAWLCRYLGARPPGPWRRSPPPGPARWRRPSRPSTAFPGRVQAGRGTGGPNK